MVGHENIRGVLVDGILPFHLHTYPEKKGPDPHGPFAGPDQRLGPAEKQAEKKKGNQQDGEQNIDDEKDDRPHGRGCSL